MQEKSGENISSSEKHLSFSYKCSCNILRAHADTAIIDLASQFAIVAVGFEATRRENSPKAAILLPKERKYIKVLGV